MQTIRVVSTASYSQARAWTSALANHLASQGACVLISDDGRSLKVARVGAAKQLGPSRLSTRDLSDNLNPKENLWRHSNKC